MFKKTNKNIFYAWDMAVYIQNKTRAAVCQSADIILSVRTSK